VGLSIVLPSWVILLVALVIVLAIAMMIVSAAAPPVIVALLARHFSTEWLESRAIARMSGIELVTAVAAATTPGAILGVAVGAYRDSYYAAFVVAWIVALPLIAAILFSKSDKAA
jgi:hypothetical protein